MYDYEKQKPELFTDIGQRVFLRVRDWIHKTLPVSGAVRMQEILGNAGTCSSWEALACVDRMVELGEIVAVNPHASPAQDRIYIKRG